MRAINLPHAKLRLRDISRELYLEHGWEMPAGLKKPEDRDPLNYSAEEAGQAKRIKRDPAELKQLLKSCWEASDSRSAFDNALREHGFCPARGDRRGFVAVDPHGEVDDRMRVDDDRRASGHCADMVCGRKWRACFTPS